MREFHACRGDIADAALVGLGWAPREADAAIEAVADDEVDDADVATVLRAALRALDRA